MHFKGGILPGMLCLILDTIILKPLSANSGVGESQVVASGHSSGVWQGRCCHGNSILDPSIGLDCTPWYGMIWSDDHSVGRMHQIK